MKNTISSAVIFFVLFSSLNLLAQPSMKATIDRGKIVYTATCLACHQADGQGVQRMNPTLVKTKWILGDKMQLIKIVLNGLKGGEIEIDGDYFHNPMPAQVAQLSEQQIADVLTYVRNNFGNNASAITAAEVKAAKASLKPVAVKPKLKSQKQ